MPDTPPRIPAFTPGPHAVDPESLTGDGKRIVDASGRAIGWTSAHRRGDPAGWVTPTEAVANAHLFSAASALLVQAKTFEMLLQFQIDRHKRLGHDEDVRLLNSTLAECRAAIAKAEGRS